MDKSEREGIQSLIDNKYKLIPLNYGHIETLYNWNLHEKELENFTCRPIIKYESLQEYLSSTINRISEGKIKVYVLVEEKTNKPLGRISLFDFNKRNHSAEFGYYLPKVYRGKGLGKILLSDLLKTIWEQDELNLNKVYATTSSNNIASIKLLEKFGFKLDGVLREHYWINDARYNQLIYSMLKYEWTK
ncbi:GNAT family N-acetyltransferase [Clostridium paridis]|uniref:GNAT family N-acetyltransferase n=1 Tax=Clostridium paridis TaxID=2803863 RepID=A0A937FA39_9CLOT|nr:GNAT family protein [Clostridium paridis]MBL4930350.1 GNAT family N-acetyltransferase [Clostridium paridis]